MANLYLDEILPLPIFTPNLTTLLPQQRKLWSDLAATPEAFALYRHDPGTALLPDVLAPSGKVQTPLTSAAASVDVAKVPALTPYARHSDHGLIH